MSHSLQPRCNPASVLEVGWDGGGLGRSALAHLFFLFFWFWYTCKEPKCKNNGRIDSHVSGSSVWSCHCVAVWAACWRVTAFSFSLLLQRHNFFSLPFNNNHVTLPPRHPLILPPHWFPFPLCGFGSAEWIWDGAVVYAVYFSSVYLAFNSFWSHIVRKRNNAIICYKSCAMLA